MKEIQHSHTSADDQVCERCGAYLKGEAANIGTFVWDGEVFGWSQITDDSWNGFFTVVDAEDFEIAVAITPEFAIAAAIEELNWIKDDVEDALTEWNL